MKGKGRFGLTRPWAVLALAIALACGLLSAASALAEKGGKTNPPEPPAGWEFTILWCGSDYDGARANGTSGGQQVGSVEGFASLWSGTAASCVSLHPVGSEYGASEAYGVDDGQQVGYVKFAADSPYPYAEHAALWSGSRESLVDLHPAWARWSRAHRVSGGRQVGFVTGSDEYLLGSAQHACLWTGTAESCVDLHPFGTAWQHSAAYGVGGDQHHRAAARDHLDARLDQRLEGQPAIC